MTSIRLPRGGARGLGVFLVVMALVAAACTSATDDTSETTSVTETTQPDATGATDTSSADDAAPTTQPTEENPLVGDLGGPEVVTDVASFPTSFSESPMLSDRVASGELPPVEERLPVTEDLLVLEPLEEVGTYGGTWRRAFTGTADLENGARIVVDKLLFTDPTGLQTRPGVAKSLTSNDDGTVFTLELREGLRWSDGELFTADDIVWWYENVWLNREMNPTVRADLSIGGEAGTIVKVDDYTVEYVFPSSYFLFEEILRGDTWVGGGPARLGRNNNGMGGYAPAHYMAQFHADHAPEDELAAAIEEGGYGSWLELYFDRNNFGLNPDKPVLGPWVTVNPINSDTWTLERNPYFYAVDTEGNQLPYIDRIEMELAEDLEVLNLRAIAGDYDFQSRHLDIAKLPVILENRESGNYRVHLNPGPSASVGLTFNHSYDGDPEIQKWQQNADFRRALSLGIDRAQINEVFFLGLGKPGSPVVDEEHPHNPGPEWRTRWSELDVEAANQLLDSIGLSERDSEGFRVRSDNGERLRLEIGTWSAQFLPFTQMAEMVARQWTEIGIFADIVEEERTLAQTRHEANETQIQLAEIQGTDNIWTNPQNLIPVVTPSRLGVPYAQWYESGGELGTEPHDPEMLRIFDLYRSAPGLPEDDRTEIAREIWRTSIEQQWTIGLIGQAPSSFGVAIVSDALGNVPERLSLVRDARIPGGGHPWTWYFREN